MYISGSKFSCYSPVLYDENNVVIEYKFSGSIYAAHVLKYLCLELSEVSTVESSTIFVT